MPPEPATIEELIADLHGESFTTSSQAAKTLVDCGSVAVGLLIPLLQEPNRQVQIRVVSILAAISSPDAIDALFVLLADPDVDLSVYRNASYALAKMGGPRIIEVLLRHLKLETKKTGPTRKSGFVVDALRQIGELLVPYLAAALTDEVNDSTIPEDNDFIMHIGFLLGEFANGQLLPSLLDALNHSNSRIILSVTTTLTKLAVRKENRIKATAAVPRLQELLHHSDSRVRAKAASALGYIGDTSVVPTLINVLYDDEVQVRMNAASALGQLKDERAIPALLNTLYDTESRYYIHFLVGPALAGFGLLAVPGLLKALATPKLHTEAYEAIEEAFVSIGRPAVPGLIRFVDADWPHKFRAIRALGRIGDETAVPVLMKVLQQVESGDNRGTAAWALGAIGDSRAIPVLIAALQEADWATRCDAAEALANFQDSRIVPMLRQALQDENSYVRVAAIRALAKSGDASVVPDLAEKLSDFGEYGRSERVRDHAVKALQQIATPEALEVISLWEG
jgi:HEAT repeat protein